MYIEKQPFPGNSSICTLESINSFPYIPRWQEDIPLKTIPPFDLHWEPLV